MTFSFRGKALIVGGSSGIGLAAAVSLVSSGVSVTIVGKNTEKLQRAIATLNKSVFFITQAVAVVMQNAGGGNIVNVGSMWAKQAIKATPSSAYSMAKAGLHAMTQHLAMELADYNIRVNAVSPAVVKTPIYNAFIPENETDEVLASFDAFHPIGRIGTPDDVDGGVMAGRN